MVEDSPDEKLWYYATGQQVYGPMRGTAIKGLIDAGNIDRSFYVLENGTQDWKPIDTVFAVGTPSTPVALTGEIEVNDGPPRSTFIGTLSSHVSKAAGLEELESLKDRKLLSEVFRHHPLERVESEFCVGSLETTPDLASVRADWPKPWIFFRSAVVSVAAYLVLIETFKNYENPNLIPSIIFFGSFGVPVSTLLLFFELNVRRNVSLFRVVLLFLVGGIASLVFALPGFSIAFFFDLDILGASVAAVVEEPAKLLAVILFARKTRFHYIHNGLLFGAAVGTGFAVFESAGYALRFGMLEGFDQMVAVINQRGALSPFAHIVWTAISAGALWRVKGESKLDFSHFVDWSFLRVFLLAIAMHAGWNAPIQFPWLHPLAKFIIIGVIGWIIVLSFVQAGIKQIAREKES